MGKGGTRFVSDPIAVRTPRQRASFSARELRRDMETYCETGVHPDIEKAQQDHEDNPADTPLPLFDSERPFVYFQFSIAGTPVGRLTVELFKEYEPHGVEILKRRCLPGSRLSLAKTRVFKLLPECAFFMGQRSHSIEKVTRPRLNHTDRGAVSLSMDDNEVAVTLREDTLALDETHRVVGRVHLGMEILDQINEVLTGPTDAPLDEILVTTCGVTGPHGEMNTARSKGASSGSKPEDTLHQLRAERERTRNELRSALQEGLSRKRKQTKHNESSQTKKRLLDHDLSSTSSSEDEM